MTPVPPTEMVQVELIVRFTSTGFEIQNENLLKSRRIVCGRGSTLQRLQVSRKICDLYTTNVSVTVFAVQVTRCLVSKNICCVGASPE